MFDARAFADALDTESVGRYLVHRPAVETTMMIARREADEGAPHGTLILAEEQTAGRGRRGRSFYSPPGENLYFTLVLRPDGPTHARLPVVVPLAVATACAAEGLDARVKWPNDIWVGERKLSGMLIDAETGATGAVVYPGIGINVNGDPTQNPDLRDIATSMRRELGRGVARERVLTAVCNAIEMYSRVPDDDLMAAYRGVSMVLGRRMTVTAGDDVYEATALAIEPGGALRVRRDDGRESSLLAAEVTIRPAEAGAR